jgi:autotransporter-associated beta strand protein
LLAAPSAQAFEWQNSGIWDSDSADRAFDSGPVWFTAGPAWMMNAMPGSHFRARSLSIDRAGDIQESTAEAPYVGTLHDVFDVNLFGNISTFGDTSATRKTSPSTLAALNLQQVWKNTAGNTNFNAGTSWISGTAPGAGDVAAFTSAAVAQPNLSASVSISGLYFKGTGTTGYDLTRTSTEILTLTATGTTIGAETGDANSVAIGAENTSNANTIDVPLALAPTTGSTSTFSQAAGGTLTINGVISGTSIALSLRGGGTVQLSGLNTYTGKTTIGPSTTLVANTLANGGTASSVGQSTNANGNLTFDGGTLRYTGGIQTTNRGFTITTNGATIDASGSGQLGFSDTSPVAFGSTTPDARSLTLTGSNVGANTLRPNLTDNSPGLTSLIKNGNGTWVLTGTNTYTGGTTISAGILRAGSTTAIGNGALTFNNGSTGTFQLNGFNISITDLTFSQTNSGSPIVENGAATPATLTVSPSGAVAFAGVLRNGSTGALGLTMNGSGQLVLYNTNTYSGATTINSGTLTFNSNTSPSISGSANNSTIHLGATVGSATATLGLGFNPPNTITSPLIVEAGGTGTRLLASFPSSGTNTFGGTITMNTGLTVQSGSNNGPSAFGTFLLNGSSVNLNSFALTVNDTPLGGSPGNLNTQGKVIISAPISGTGGSIVKNGGGTLILQGANNSYTGGTQIGGGVLGIDRDLSLGAVPLSETTNISFTGSATLQDTANNVTLAVNRDITVASGATATFDSNGNAFTINGSMSGSGNIAKAGAGTLTLTGPNFVTGSATINTNGGTLNAAANSALGSGSVATGTPIGPTSITVNSGGTLMLSNSAATDRVRSDAPITLAGGIIGRSGPGVVSEGSGSTKTNGIPNGGTSTIGLGALTLTSNSTINFNLLSAGGVGTLTFASFSSTGSTLNITNWVSAASFTAQTSGVDGTDDRLIFGGTVAPNTAFITFDGAASGLIPLDAGFWEVVPLTPVPEPSTWIGAALALGAIGWTQRKRFAKRLRRV